MHDVPGYKILDNGEAEHYDRDISHQTRGEELLVFARALGADEVVVPDRMEDGVATARWAKEFGRIADPTFRYLAVAQGAEWEDVLTCIDKLADMDYITSIALPRVLTRADDWVRVELVEYILDVYVGRFEAIHCLGSGHNTQEVKILCDLPVRGIDTSMPLVLGLRELDIEQFPYTKRQEHYFTRRAENDTQRDAIDYNVAVFLEWAKCRQEASPCPL
jgi:hypothetical protein